MRLIELIQYLPLRRKAASPGLRATRQKMRRARTHHVMHILVKETEEVPELMDKGTSPCGAAKVSPVTGHRAGR